MMIAEISKERLSTMGPFPAQILFNWLTVTISLMEHADNFRVRTTAERGQNSSEDAEPGEFDGQFQVEQTQNEPQ